MCGFTLCYSHTPIQDTGTQMIKGLVVSHKERGELVIDVSLYHPSSSWLVQMNHWWGFFGSNSFCWVTIYLNVAINLLLDSPPWISVKASAQSHLFAWIYFVNSTQKEFYPGCHWHSLVEITHSSVFITFIAGSCVLVLLHMMLSDAFPFMPNLYQYWYFC